MPRTKVLPRKSNGGRAPRMGLAARAPRKPISYGYRTLPRSNDMASGEDEAGDDDDTISDLSEEDDDNNSGTTQLEDDVDMQSASDSDSETESDPGRRQEACSRWRTDVVEHDASASPGDSMHQEHEVADGHVPLSDLFNVSDDETSVSQVQPRLDNLKSPAPSKELQKKVFQPPPAIRNRPSDDTTNNTHFNLHRGQGNVPFIAKKNNSVRSPDGRSNARSTGMEDASHHDSHEPTTKTSYIDSQRDLMLDSLSWEAREQYKRTGVHPFNLTVEDMQKNANAAAARRAAASGEVIKTLAAPDNEAQQTRRWLLEAHLPDVDTTMPIADPTTHVRVTLANARIDLRAARTAERNYVYKYRCAFLQAAQRRLKNRPAQEQQQAETYLQSCAEEREKHETDLRRASNLVFVLRQAVICLGVRADHTPLEVKLAQEQRNDGEEKKRLASLGLPVPRWVDTGMQMLKAAVGPDSDSEDDE